MHSGCALLLHLLVMDRQDTHQGSFRRASTKTVTEMLASLLVRSLSPVPVTSCSTGPVASSGGEGIDGDSLQLSVQTPMVPQLADHFLS